MAIVFAVRGDSFDARYSTGGKSPMNFNPGQIAIVAGGIAGSYFDFTSAQTKFLAYSAYKNVPNSRTISINIHWKPDYNGAPPANRVLWAFLSGPGTVSAYLELRHITGTGQLSLVCKNELGATIVNVSLGVYTAVSGTPNDITVTWTGTTGASALNVAIDSVSLYSGSVGGSLTASWNNTDYWRVFCLGSGPNITVSSGYYGEIVIWDTIIDPTSVALVGGTGALNGAGRALVDVVAFDGQTNSEPGVANVRNGQAYTVAGVAYSGTAVIPSLANTKTGVAGDGGTGTYDGSDRWTDPGVANVSLGVTYKANSTTENKTGTLTVSCDYPATTNVRLNTSYDSGAKVGTLIVPAVGDVRAGISVDATVGTLQVEQENISIEVDDYESITVTVEGT